ncbi:MAG: aldehyde dehydrogenase family protein [Acidobacteriota bacterium]
MQNYKMLIGGELVDAVSGQTYDVINPATGEVIAKAPLGSQVDAERAVAAAQKAFPVWSKMRQDERSRIVSQIAAAILEHVEELAWIETLDHGTPIDMAIHGAIPGAAEDFEYYAYASRALMGGTFPARPGVLSYIMREPIGVCAQITPWNDPLGMIGVMTGPALAVGNACIVKPPSIDSLAALKFGEILSKLDIPPGAVNIISGPGDTVGETLASHPAVGKVAVTGSCETGKRIMACASKTVKQVNMELGGKNPFIILEDADLDAAVGAAVFSSFFNGGMVCACPGRFYVHEKLHAEFVDRFVEGAKRLVVGDPTDPKTQMGPMVSEEHRNNVEGYIKSGIDQGAGLVLGGIRPTTPPLDKGFYVMPTVFTNVTQNMKIAREEIFGPVVCIIKFSSEDQVVEMANDNTFGLSASVWTKDTGKGLRFAHEIQAGWVWVNEHLRKAKELPWGGYKESGFGRAGSIYSIEEYTQLKVVWVNLGK